MRFLLSICITALLSYFALFFFPWWVSLLLAFGVSWLLPMKPGRAFLAGALGVAICWFLSALFIDMANQHLLSSKMAVLFGLPSYPFMLALSTFIGFITGGLGGWTATYLQPLIHNKPTATPEAIE